MKLGIVGAGTVGRACLVASVMRGMAREIVLVDRTEKKARGMVTDVTYGAVLSPSVSMRAGDYADLAGCALVMLTIGVNEKAGGATDRSDPEGRLKLLAKNKAIFQERRASDCEGGAGLHSAGGDGPAGRVGGYCAGRGIRAERGFDRDVSG